MRKKMLFIYNPHAGKSAIGNKLSDIIQMFCSADYEVTIYATQGQKDASNLVIELGEAYDYIVCSGGDGTLNEVTDGLMHLEKRPPCGYIPAGTVNDFASSLRIPKIMKKAADIVVDGHFFACDIGKFNDRHFTYIAGFGAFTEVSYETPQNKKNMLGRMAYVLEGAMSIPNIKSYHLRLEYDGKIIEDDFLFGMISNSFSIAGFKAFTGVRHVKLNDGLFEAVFIKMPKSPLDLQATVNCIMAREADPEYMYFFRTSDLMVCCDEEEVQWTLDGESGGSCNKAHITNEKCAIEIAIPKS